MHAEEVAIVTGANRGIGLATAEGLARDGMTVVLACRSEARGREAEARVRSVCGHERAVFLPCDLADPESVDDFAAAFRARFDRLDALVANAGLTLLERQVTGLGVELGWHVGVLGHYQLVRRLLPALTAYAPGRVVWLAGLYHRKGQLRVDDLDWSERDWDWSQAGCDAQLAKVMLTVELAEQLAGTGIVANAVHPGAVRTHAQDGMPLHLRLLMDTVMRPAFVSPARGARPVLRLVEDPDLAEVSGRWFRKYQEAEPHPLVADAAARSALWTTCAERLGLEP